MKKIKFLLELLKQIQILPSWFILLIDISLVSIITIGSYLFFKELGVHFSTDTNPSIRFIIIIIVFIIYFLLFKTYKGIVRYSTFKDIIKIFKVVLLSFITIILLNESSRLLYHKSLFENYIILNGIFFVFFSLIGFRISVKFIFQILF